jgi:hypothetical protein
MRFELHSTGGNLAGGEWISAEGDIETRTPFDFEDFVAVGDFASSPMAIRINSTGGDLLGGLRLGELIREYGFSTEVGSTAPEGMHYQRVSGTCQSAATLTFIGGTLRDAKKGEVGVHQFYYPRLPMYGARELSEHQALSAALIDYAVRMGVDPRFVATGSATSPQSMHFFSEEELDAFRIRWIPHEYEPWQLFPLGGGVVARSVTRDRSERVEVFANSSLTLRLHRPAFNDQEWMEGAMSVLSEVNIFGQILPPTVATYHRIGEEGVVDLCLGSFDTARIDSSKQYPVWVEGPRYMQNSFAFDIPRHELHAMMVLAIKNSVSL